MTLGARRLSVAALAAVLGCLLLCLPGRAQAADVVLLPAGGGSPAERAWLDRTLPPLLAQLDLAALSGPAAQAVIDRRAGFERQDSSTWLAVGDEAGADWVLGAELSGPGRVRLTACWVAPARVQSLERLLPQEDPEGGLREMLVLLIRPTGVGPELPPWAAPGVTIPAPPPEPQPQPEPVPVPAAGGTPPVAVIATDPPVVVAPPPWPPREPDGQRRVHMDYMLNSEDVWPPYSAGHPLLLAAYQGFAVTVLDQRDLELDAAAFVVGGRGGVAVGDAGLELFAGVAGAAVGPDVLWAEAGIRWLLTPSVLTGNPDYGLSFHVGPELSGGAFIQLADPAVVDRAGEPALTATEVNPTFGAALDMVLAATPQIAADMSIGDLRWVPTGTGSLVALGASLGLAVRLP